jgi:hypothetical protein
MATSLIDLPFITIAGELDGAGLFWQPVIGDEVSFRESPEQVSILVDPDGMTPRELRETFIWLPTVEQLVTALEARQAILFHAGLEMERGILSYKTVIQSKSGLIESLGDSLRLSVGVGLRDLLYLQNRKNLN